LNTKIKKVREIKSQFTVGHFSAVAIAVVAIGGLLTVQNWNSVQAMFEKNVAAKQETSLYYAYQAPVNPEVLGADTQPDGPGVINEDGTVTSLSSLGNVLGASSDAPEINLDDIKVRTVDGNADNLRQYFDDSFVIESKILPGDFETALVSVDQGQTQAQLNLMNQVQQSLQNMAVPRMAEKLHKLKIAQYRTAIDLLKNYYQADSNPEFVAGKLTQFMDMQKHQENETQNLFSKYPQL
jgi:hypothetical protein